MMCRCRRLVVQALLVLTLVAGFSALWAAGPVAATPPSVASSSAIVLDAQTGIVLYSTHARDHREMASCTKIMTALLAIQHLSPNKMLRVPAAVTSLSGTRLGLRPGQQISTGDALLALLIKSANDAGLTLACAVSGNEAKFVRLMNAAASLWGLNDTHYDNCVGNRADSHHYSCARDLAVLGRRAMQEPRFRDVVGLRYATAKWSGGHSLLLVNGNTLLEYPWADGVKPGVTRRARYCLVGSGHPGLRNLIVVTMHAASRTQMLADQLALFDFASTLYSMRDLVQTGDAAGVVQALDGTTFPVETATSISGVVRNAARVTKQVVIPVVPAVTPSPGTVVGTLDIWSDGLLVGSTSLAVASQP